MKLIKAIFLVLFIHMTYDWTINAMHSNFHAFAASLWNMALFGFIGFVIIDSSLQDKFKYHQNVKLVFSIYFVYRFFLNLIAFLVSFVSISDSWSNYKQITSNYYVDCFVWSFIGLSLIIVSRKYIYNFWLWLVGRLTLQ